VNTSFQINRPPRRENESKRIPLSFGGADAAISRSPIEILTTNQESALEKSPDGYQRTASNKARFRVVIVMN
jgi:hypothetical protein